MAVSAAFSRLLPRKQAFSPPDLRGFTPPPTNRRGHRHHTSQRNINSQKTAAILYLRYAAGMMPPEKDWERAT
jgi:hypothetical protein